MLAFGLPNHLLSVNIVGNDVASLVADHDVSHVLQVKHGGHELSLLNVANTPWQLLNGP